MSDREMKTYEGMFLLDCGNPDFHVASEPARVALEKNGAEILSMKPWDERRLAYEIRGRRRGLYVLTYFRAPPERIAEVERDCQLDERVLRLLVVRRDHLSEETIRADTPATAGAKRAAARKAEDAAALAAASPGEDADSARARKAKARAEARSREKPAEADKGKAKEAAQAPAGPAAEAATVEAPAAEAPAADQDEPSPTEGAAEEATETDRPEGP